MGVVALVMVALEKCDREEDMERGRVREIGGREKEIIEVRGV